MKPDANPTTIPEPLYKDSQAYAFEPSIPLVVVFPLEDQAQEPPNSLLPMTLFIVSTLIALLMLVRTWKSHGRLFEKLFWSVFLFIPVFGPLFFLVFYPGRSEFEARRWAAMSSVTRLGGGGWMSL